jgi:hypothetical protein
VRTPLVVAALLVWGGGLVGQALRPTFVVLGVPTRVRTTVPGSGDVLNVTALGVEGAIAAGRWQAELSYFEGEGPADTASTTARSVVEGRALLGFRARPWLVVKAGVHARSYAVTGGILRWLFWELRARGEAPFIGTAVTGYGELWRALVADVNVPERFDHAQGGEAGMVLRLARAPLEARIGYRIDHLAFGGGTRLETVDGVVIGVGIGRR